MSKKVEGKLILDYVPAPTKFEEFIINFKRVSDLMVKFQLDMPNTMKRYFEIIEGLEFETEEQAANAILKLEEIVFFPNKEGK